MLQLLLGTDWVSVRDEILRLVSEDVQREKTGRILMVPELISHDMERRLCAAAGDTASRYAEVLSFPRLARRVADSVGCAAQSCMDNGGRVVAMAAAARQLHSRLKAYAAVQTRPEFLSGLVDAVDEFKRCCISYQDLAQAARQTDGSLAQKLEELSLLLEAYDSLCARGKRDPRDLMNWLLEQLEDDSFGQDHVFYIDGFPDFTRQHLAILEHLIRVSPSVTVGLNCDRVDSDRMAFEKAGDTASQLIRCARQAGIPVEIQLVQAENTPVSPVCRGLFQGQIEPVSQVTVYRTDSAFQEVGIAADKILELIRGGCRYRDISVVCTDMAAYSSLICLQFHRCGIPVYTSGTEDILQKNGITTVLSALEAALEGFDQAAVLRYLRSALSPLSLELCDRVENYAILWGIRGNRWLNNWENHPGGLSQNWTERSKGDLEVLNQARKKAIEPLRRLRDRFRDSTDLSGQVRALYNFLEETEFPRKLSSMASRLDESGDNRGAQILNQLWEILLTALEQLYDVLGKTAWEPEAFIRLFSLLLSQYDVGTIPPVLDAVTVGPVSAMRCQQEKHLFILGAEEGKLPGYGGSAGILSDQERVTLRSMGVPLTGGALDGLQAEFAEVYGVFCGARETVCVSCSGSQPSYVYRRLAQMAGAEERQKELLGPALTDPVETGAYLALWQAGNAARELGVEEFYSQIIRKAGYRLGRIEKENVNALYGNTLLLSASQVDRQAECRMSYFLKYGMGAKERKEATVDPAEFGTFVHAVLEDTARAVMERGGFHEVSLEETLQIALAFADAYTSEHFSQIDSQRLSYLFRRNRRELEMVVTELWQELKSARFQPSGFEVAFGNDGDMPAIDIPAAAMSAQLRGFVDRVDIWKENGKSYFRVVDYKTGKKDFDYCDVCNGVGLQMLLYLFALEQGGQNLLGEDPVAAGVQYFPARVPIVAADGYLTDEEAELARRKEWKRKGLLLRDEQVLEAMDPVDSGRLCCTRRKDGSLSGDLAERRQLRLLERHVMRTLRRMVDDIASGNVEPNPYTRGSAHNACAYCPYGSVCHERDVGDRRNYKAMTAQRFWEELEKEDRNG